MKASWQKIGAATGEIRCHVSLPAADIELDRRCTRTLHPLREARRYIVRNLPTAPSALEGGMFTIQAEIRAGSRGVRWKILSRWKAGESVELALDRASVVWAELSKESHRVKLR